MVTNGEYIKKWLSDMKIKKFSVWKSDKGTINRNNGYAFASKDDESSETNIENFFDWCQRLLCSDTSGGKRQQRRVRILFAV